MPNPSLNVADGLVVDDLANGVFRVNRRVFTDPDILELEKRLVFDQSWLYVGHESELPEHGSYIQRKVGGRPVLFVRDDAGTARVFFDTCTHRGNSIVQAPRGKTARFLCFYHGWAFNTRGDLVNVPDQAGYGGNRMKKAELSLGTPARVESYRGLYFMSAKPDIVDLKTYLGGALPYIDDIIDMTDSEMVIAPGQQSYSMNSNWKLLIENSADAYHGVFTHQRFFMDYVKALGADTRIWQDNLLGHDDQNKVVSFQYGHAVMDMPTGPLPFHADNPALFAQLKERLLERFGPERTDRMLNRSRNLIIFPNLIMISSWRTIRTFYPLSPDYMEVNAWCLVGKDDSPELRRARMDNFITFLGPTGFGTPDDNEALANCQKGFAATEEAWSDLSKGMLREGGAMSNDELHIRTIWRRWYSLLNPRFKASQEQSHDMASLNGSHGVRHHD